MRILKDTYLSAVFPDIDVGNIRFRDGFTFSRYFLSGLRGLLLTTLLLLFVELFELYKRVDGIDALRVVADKLSNGEKKKIRFA